MRSRPPLDAAQQRFATDCERTLVACAGRERAGTRQLRRAAARRFVRRHRHDHGYLAWVLRSVGASSALAVALLGLGAEPARAGATLFTQLAGASSPIDGEDVGLSSAPALGDLDADGDLDLVSGDRFFGFHYFENLGDATAAFFVERFDANNPLDGQDIGSFAMPALGDLDADGDLDLVAGEREGAFFYFENTGNASSPAFAQRFGFQNPFIFFHIGADSRPALADLDGDGDLDLVSGETYGGFFYFENTGSATSPAFEERTGEGNPLDVEDVGYYSVAAFGDLDGDGDLELVAGEAYGSLVYFENTGDAFTPKMHPRPNAANPLAGHSTGLDSAPTLGDLDADGDLDLVTGKLSGYFDYLENLSGRFLGPQTGTANPLEGLDAGALAKASFGDLDGDGDLELLVGQDDGTFHYFENMGTGAYVRRTGSANPMDNQDVGSQAAPALADLDGDFDLDLLAGTQAGTFVYFENTGSYFAPLFALRTGAGNPLDGVDLGSASLPALGDLDGDTDVDLLAGALPAGTATIYFFENTGGAHSPAFPPAGVVLISGSLGPLAPALGDVDGDNDLDLATANQLNEFSYFENDSRLASPTFVEHPEPPFDLTPGMQGHTPALADVDGDGDPDLVAASTIPNVTGFYFLENALVERMLSVVERVGPSTNPLWLEDVGFLSTPELADLDRDGDLDLVAGEEYNALHYFENTGSAASPVFAKRIESANPFLGLEPGSESDPALGDLDGDGDFDLLVGQYDGTLAYFENTGSATSPAFAERTGSANPLDGQDVDFHARPTLGDLDSDGDLDLVVGAIYGTLFYFENTGSAVAPVFVSRTGAENPLGDASGLTRPSPAFGDVDGDGDLDLAVGIISGPVTYFENTGSATSPAFAQRTGDANPFGVTGSAIALSPTLGDLDGDGDPDLVTGENDGVFRTFYLPEPGHGALLGAGIALLRWLGRRRDRRR